MQIRVKNKKYKIQGLILILTAFFFLTTVVLGYNLSYKLKQVIEVKEVLAATEQKQDENRQQIDESQTSISELEGQIKALEVELQKIERENAVAQKNKEDKTRHAYLTFDDGPTENTRKILDFLKANDIKATFFVIGTEGYDDVYKRIVDEGHTIGIHSNTHRYDQIYKSKEAFMKDINALSDRIYNLTGVRSNIFRFPGGSNNTISKRYNKTDIMGQLTDTIEQEGYHYFDWNVDSLDASASTQDKDIIVQSVIEGARDKNNAIILMHDAAAKTTTVEALPEIVEGLRKQGYIFDKMDETTVPIHFK